MNASQTLALNLKLWRARRGMSQTTLAKECSITQPYLSRIERNLQSPSLETIEGLARALAVEPNVLLRKDEPSEQHTPRAA